MPANREQVLQHAVQLLRARKVGESIELLHSLLRANAMDANAHHWLGVALAMHGEREQALKHLQTAVRLKPDDPLIHFNLGKLYQQLQRLGYALAEFAKALLLKPDYTAARQAFEETKGKISLDDIADIPELELSIREVKEHFDKEFRCAWHPDAVATTRCEGCKRPICIECEQFVFGVRMCSECAEKERKQAYRTA